MSEYADNFVNYLQQLSQRDRKGLAVLRRSVGFEPGSYVPAYPYVERFVKPEWSAKDSRRKALYIIAGLYALNPRQGEAEVAASLGRFQRSVDRESIEHRFLALLSADPENIHTYLRQVVTLLSTQGYAVNYTALYWDVARWINPFTDMEKRDDIRQRWARGFYRELEYRGAGGDPSSPENIATSNNQTTA